MTHGEFYTPDFVILGVPADDGVYVYASKELTRAELEAVAERREIEPNGIYRQFEMGTRAIILTTTMREIVLVKGATYAEAFRSLFANWTPDEPEQKQLPGTPVVPELIDGCDGTPANCPTFYDGCNCDGQIDGDPRG